jgi:hypothetical protein
MAVEINDSNKVVVEEIKRFTGVQSLHVVAVNPDKAQLLTLGYEVTEEPKYEITFEQEVDEKDEHGELTGGKVKVSVTRKKVVFYLANKAVGVKPTKLEYLVSDELEVSSKGNIRVINDQVQSTWGASIEAIKANEKMTWLRTETLRQACVGEVAVHEFVVAWCNVATNKNKETGKYGTCRLDFQKIGKGDVSELRQLVAQAKANLVKVLLYVLEVTKDNGQKAFYQNIYDRVIMRNNQKEFTKLMTELNSQYGKLKPNATIQSSLEFQEFAIPTSFTPLSPDSEASAPMGGANAAAVEEEFA